MLQIFLILFQFQVSAMSLPIQEDELLKVTQIEKDYLLTRSNDFLNSIAFTDDEGTTCGLESHKIVSYFITQGTLQAPTEFEVKAIVEGPAGRRFCDVTTRFNCYVTWKLKSNGWSPAYSDCDETLYNE
jgi:hypothetical protein